MFALPADGHDYGAELGQEMKGLRVAYSEHFGYGMPVADDVRALVRRAFETLAGLGAEIEEIAPFFDHDLYDALADATFTGLRGLATSLVGTHTQRLSPRVARDPRAHRGRIARAIPCGEGARDPGDGAHGRCAEGL